MEQITSLLPSMLDGLKVTLEVFLITLALAIPLGIIIALGRLSNITAIKSIISSYILLMRGTPLLLQLIFIFFGLPLVGIVFDRFTTVIIAFVLNYAAYFGEIFRAGIQSVDKGQYEAAEVLGLSRSQTFKRIILPQMTKKVLPPVSNEVITLIKDSALVYVVGLDDMLRVAKIASNTSASLLPLVFVGIIYLLLTAILTNLFKRLENRYSYYK
ncbi:MULTISPECIES: amino acid ABC transporter permease [Bacillaceae]|jgi:polar amino acid transport system permease protein|uniref:Amino acid ABC transporter permease n=1 Tax=Gottfriedia luciferensis TaxID=178774 RepID=A0ABX2ZTQ9_9BACI|nr:MULTISPECIES: amino acid ABC transporter permease [Bacillaceae]ODG93105.1 amino acid ABC transporter permease [Gottfriedia luciferensis]PGZ91777.1 amino acid ABC transporter permease [Bacillus sp. AFS029533]SFD08527.1 amino acid ABC transporter membrane protein, PAAT family [Bacillus sp. UNCCL81]